MTRGTILMPAYGRIYADADAMRKDWEAGKDFRLYGSGQYCSIRDIAALQQRFPTAMIIDPRGPATHTIF